MQTPLLARADLVALSFVHGLQPIIVYPLLRGEPPIVERPQRLPFNAGEIEEVTGDANAPAATPSRLTLEDFLAEAAVYRDDVKGIVADARSEAERAERGARAEGLHLVAWGDACYPPLLAFIFDPPLVLWVHGSLDVLARTMIAVVGSRGASPYGEQTAARLGSELAAAGVVVASGMARGIDGAAHRGALDAGGETVAVLGCGVDVAYPPEHAALAREIVRHGAVISEYTPHTAPAPFHFPARNRIISGLSRGVVVVEASNRSGALITADCALEQGREVMAVPGSVMGERHRGSHTLLKAGAALVESAADILAATKLTGPRSTHDAPRANAEEDPTLRALADGGACGLEELCAASGRPMAELLPRLLELELQGLVRRLPGGRFMRSAEIVLR